MRANKFIGKLEWPPKSSPSNPLDAYLWNATVEVQKGRGEPYTIIEHLKRWIKKVWHRAINTEHIRRPYFDLDPVSNK